MKRAAVLPLAALGIAVSVSSPPCLAQKEFRSLEAQQVEQYKRAVVAYDKARAALEKKDKEAALEALAVCFSLVPEFPRGTS